MSPPRIVVGIERSERTDDALALARMLAAPAAARFVLAGACEFPVDRARRREHRRPVRRGGPRRRRGRSSPGETAAVRRDRPATSREVVSTFGSPASLLQSAAEEQAADARRDRLDPHDAPRPRAAREHRRAAAGRRPLPGRRRPPAAMPPGARHLAPSASASAFDGSAEARAATRRRHRAGARAYGAALRVLTVLDVAGFASPALMGGPGYDRVHAEVEATAQAHLDEVVADARRAIVATEGRLLAGAPGRLLAEASADLDLLLMGSRGYGPLRAVLLGGVSGRLVREARLPADRHAARRDAPDRRPARRVAGAGAARLAVPPHPDLGRTHG